MKASFKISQNIKIRESEERRRSVLLNYCVTQDLIMLNNCRFQVLYLAVKTLRESGHEHVYDAVEKPLLLAQSAAVLEVHLSDPYIE